MPHTRPLRVAATLLATLGLVTPAAVHHADHAGATTVASKRGLASAVYLRTDQAGKIKAAGASWTYNWTARLPESMPGLEVVPMVRDSRAVTSTIITRLRNGKLSGAYRHLLGFNEPDNAKQANLTPYQAAALWPRLMATGLSLGAPATTVPTNGWLRSFMQIAAARKLRVDFIPLHFYARLTDTNALNRIKLQLTAVRQHYGKPIWVTELGLINSGTASAATKTAMAQRFLKRVAAMLDGLPYVQRYAWMADNTWTRASLHYSSIYDGTGRLTPVGATFRSLP